MRWSSGQPIDDTLPDIDDPDIDSEEGHNTEMYVFLKFALSNHFKIILKDLQILKKMGDNKGSFRL